jgi:pyruvate, orthophosphate dikinase
MSQNMQTAVPQTAKVKNTTTLYHFGMGPTNAIGLLADILGGKGYGLVVMASEEKVKVPIPPGFILPTTECKPYLESKKLSASIIAQVEQYVAKIGEKMGRTFGDPDNPMLLSSRSGAAISMPGMLKTILNIGTTRATIPGLAKQFGNDRFAWDCYRRLIDMWAETVLDVDHKLFEHAFESYKKDHDIATDQEMTSVDMERLCSIYEVIFEEHTGMSFPQNVWDQLLPAIEAVFKSWYGQKAVDYRKIEKLDDLLGTAVVVMAMVYGNLNDNSATGVLFTRNPSTGADELYGEILFNAQGEDVVAGIRTPEPISRLKELMPEVYDELFTIVKHLEVSRKDIQDIEFTIENGQLYMLQTRSGKRNGTAAFKIAYDMVQEGLVTKEEAILNLVKPDHVVQMLLPCFAEATQKTYRDQKKVFAKGLAASPGAAVGRIVFDKETAVSWVEDGETVILVRKETSPEDIKGMHAASAVLTSTGGLSSHAAVVLRGWGRPCVVGAEQCSINYDSKTVIANGVTLYEGDWISLNGTTGEVVVGQWELSDPVLTDEFFTVLTWADDIRQLGVRANCETPEDARLAREYGAEGIGLFRTEHMFYGEHHANELYLMKKMILSNSTEEKEKVLAGLLPAFKHSFKGTLIEMDGLPVTVRLLDPPLHEFAAFGKPANDHEANEQLKLKLQLCHDLQIDLPELEHRIDALHEANPGSGFRGSRLGVVYPAITATQVKALCETIMELREEGYKPHLEIEVPFIFNYEEYRDQYDLVLQVAESYGLETPKDFLVGSMLENMGACFEADKLAPITGFQTFGTNDLSSSVMNISRDDASKFLSQYLEKKILKVDPFQTLHPLVAKAMKIAIDGCRSVKGKTIEIGICGEQGGDPESIKTCEQLGLDYVSCSLFRIPVARLAAAQATLRLRK